MAAHHSPPTAEQTEITVRPMQPDDLDAVLALDARVFGEPRRGYFERRLAELDQREPVDHSISLVAEAAGAIVGFVMGTLTSGEFGFTQVTALVDSIAVHPDWQRRGMGRQLTSAFITSSATRGAREVYTLVNWSAWDLLKFFDALGFSLAPTVPLRRSIS